MPRALAKITMGRGGVARRTFVALRRNVSAVMRDPSLQTHRCSAGGMQDAADLADPLVDVRDVAAAVLAASRVK